MIAFILQIEDDAGRKLMIEIYRHYFRLIKKHMSNAIPADDVEDCIQDCFVRLTANVQQLKKIGFPTDYSIHPAHDSKRHRGL